MRIPVYAAFLACSWTWCIGMYLPVLLLRDLGPWSFAPFALANCLGAAAFGIMLWRRGASQRLLAEHLPAARAFSLATIAFQGWFLWRVMGAAGAGWQIAAGGGVAGAVLGVLAAKPRFHLRAAGALAAYGASLVLVGLWFSQSGLPTEQSLPSTSGKWADLLALTLVCLLGFLLCPYLDFTFHAARQSLPGRLGTRAFLVGFLVLFPLMIGGTLLYAIDAARGNGIDPLLALHPFILAHMALQLMFTAALHQACLVGSAPTRGRATVESAGAMLLVPLVLGAVERWLVPSGGIHAGLAFPEIVYRVFMGLYGLVFPAYVLLCVVGAEGVRPAPDRRSLLVCFAVVAMAAPAFYLGFIERKMLWLLPGVLIVLLGKGLIRPTGHAQV
jgi:hypothetical protein